jgi:hypothetical protein
MRGVQKKMRRIPLVAISNLDFSNWRRVFETSELILLTGSAGKTPPEPFSARLALKWKRKERFQFFGGKFFIYSSSK